MTRFPGKDACFRIVGRSWGRYPYYSRGMIAEVFPYGYQEKGGGFAEGGDGELVTEKPLL